MKFPMLVKIQTGAEFNYLKQLQNNGRQQIAGVTLGTGASLPTEPHWVRTNEGDVL